MENNPLSTVEDDDSEKDDEKSESSKRRSTRPLSRVPLGGYAEKKEEQEPKPRLSLSEQLLEKMAAKKEAEKAESGKAEEVVEVEDKKLEQDQEQAEIVEEVVETETKPEDQNIENSDDPQQSEAEPIDFAEKIESTEKQREPDQEEQTIPENKNDALEAANWESEGELDDEGEITLSAPESSDKQDDETDKNSGFAERPIETPDTSEEPVTETGPVEPELLESGIGGEGPPEPPETAPDSSGEDLPDDSEPERIDAPATSYAARSAGDRSPWYDAAAAERAREEEIRDAEYYAEKRGLSRGLGTGLLFGWLFGRRGKKKAAAEHAKELKAKDQEIKDLNEQQLLANNEQEKLKRNIESQRAENAEQAKKQATETLKLVNNPANKAENLKANEQTSRKIEFVQVNEKENDFVKLALGQSPELNKKEKLNTSLKPEEKPITEETYAVPEGRRVETSAWHRIEIDEKTGKPVNNPEIEYGDEFKRERRQEIKREDDNIKTSSLSSAASQLGSLATVDLAKLGLGDVNETQDVAAENAKKSDPHHEQLTAGAEILRFASMPIIWIAAVLIVVVLFMVGILR